MQTQKTRIYKCKTRMRKQS